MLKIVLDYFKDFFQALHRLEKYLNIQDCLEKSLKNKSALKSTGKSLKSLLHQIKAQQFYIDFPVLGLMSPLSQSSISEEEF